MVGWHHQLNGHKFEQTPGDGEGQGSLASCSPGGRKESDVTYSVIEQQQSKVSGDPSKRGNLDTEMWTEEHMRHRMKTAIYKQKRDLE